MLLHIYQRLKTTTVSKNALVLSAQELEQLFQLLCRQHQGIYLFTNYNFKVQRVSRWHGSLDSTISCLHQSLPLSLQFRRYLSLACSRAA